MQSSAEDIYYWLMATRLESFGPLRLKQLLSHFSDLKALFAATREELTLLGLTSLQIAKIKKANWDIAEKDLLCCKKMDCHIISYLDNAYPLLLRQLPDAPLLLFVRGDVSLLSKSQLAIVGTRNPTPAGKRLSHQFGFYLAQKELVITSGLALGIDAASHKGALEAGGKTIAVCGTGLAKLYPAIHQRLAEDILLNGAIVSELPPDAPPKAKHFPMRNRLISGLSLGVLVIEAALRSGSLITARIAVEQGREVFALPGSVHNPLAKGCHYLIQQGAKLVETADDILEEIGFLSATQPHLKHLTLHQSLVLEQIGYEITPLDAIIKRSGLTVAEVSSILLLLELEGYVTVIPGGYFRN